MKAWMEAGLSRLKRILRAKLTARRCCGWKSMSILYSVDGAVARITLNRPEKRNALNDELLGVLKDSLALSAEDEQVRVVLLAGAGQDFCSGADLAALDRAAEEGVLDHLATARELADIFLQMRRHPKPIV